jgi:1,4-alpha-glucan branching enzyme/maltooligosyltrehalose trehalohydrolase
VHLVLENDANEARYLGNSRYTAQWNDDIHHALHILATGETDGYYADYADAPLVHLGRCLTEGFAYQGEASTYHDGAARGEPSAHLPLQAFVSFLQNHDQVGNRALGERLTQLAPAPAVRAAAAILLLAPSIPLLFMGEEFGATTPFQFFCDFGGDLRDAVTRGRRQEFRKFTRFADPAAQAAIPDPNDSETFLASKLDWRAAADARGSDSLAYYRGLLKLRRDLIVPRLRAIEEGAAAFEVSAGGLRVRWQLGDGSQLQLVANLSQRPLGTVELEGRVVFATSAAAARGVLGPWSVAWTLVAKEAADE